MAVGPYSWSLTANDNGAADASVNFAEGQLPPSINNSARALMAGFAGWLDSVGGAATYGGSSSDYTITNPSVAAWSSYASGQLIMLKANHTSDDTAVNVNVDGLGNKRVKLANGADPAVGAIVSGGLYLLAYDGTNFVMPNTVTEGGIYQPFDATLAALAALSWSGGNQFPYLTAADTFALGTMSANALSFNAAANYGAMRTALGVAIGSDVQAYDADTAKTDQAQTWTAGQIFTAAYQSLGVKAQASTVYGAYAYYNSFGVARWVSGILSDADGSQQFLTLLDGSGGFLASVWTINSSTGVLNFGVAPTISGNAIWHAGNDGPGSGLDADTLDGVQASAFATISGAETLTNKTLDSFNLSNADTTIARLSGGQLGVEGKAALQHDGSYTSGKVTLSTSDPSGGSDGDVWFKYTA